MSNQHITDEILDQDGNPLGGAAGASLAGGWKFDTGTADANPGNKKFRFNNATQPAATQIFINKTGNSGVDAGAILLALGSGDKLYIQESTDSSRFHLVNVTGTPVDATTYVKIPIAVLDSGADLRNNRDCLLILFFSAGDGGGAASPYNLKWWPKRFYSSAQDFDASGSDFLDLQMEGLPIWIPKTDTFDAILTFLGLKQIPGLPPTDPDFAAGSILRVGLYDNDDSISGFWPKDRVVVASDFDLTTLNPLGGGAKEITLTIADTLLTGERFYWLIAYHNVNQASTNGFTVRTRSLDFTQPYKSTVSPFFIRGVDTGQSPFAPLPATFPFPGLGQPLANTSGEPPFLALRKK